MKRWQKGMILGGVGLFALAGYIYVRRAYYTRQTDKLILLANDFPRRYWVGESQKRATLLVVLGDSTAAGVGASSLQDTIGYRVARHFAGKDTSVEVQSFAVSGARLDEVMRQVEQMASRPADLIVISISANDATSGTSPALLATQLRSLLRTLVERAPKARIALTTTPNFRHTPALPGFINRLLGGRAMELSKMIRQVAKEFPNVSVADLFNDGTLSPDDYSADGFHPNGKGYAVWADTIIQALR